MRMNPVGNFFSIAGIDHQHILWITFDIVWRDVFWRYIIDQHIVENSTQRIGHQRVADFTDTHADHPTREQAIEKFRGTRALEIKPAHVRNIE